MVATAENAMLPLLRNLIGGVHTTVTKDAAGHVQLYVRPEVVLLESAPLELVAGACFTMFVTQILQVTFASLIANGAIERVIDEQKFHDASTSFGYFFAGDIFHFHAVHNRCAAAGYQLGHGSWIFFAAFAYLHQTGTAFTAAAF